MKVCWYILYLVHFIFILFPHSSFFYFSVLLSFFSCYFSSCPLYIPLSFISYSFLSRTMSPRSLSSCSLSSCPLSSGPHSHSFSSFLLFSLALFPLFLFLLLQYPPKKNRAFFENYSVFQIQANESPWWL